MAHKWVALRGKSLEPGFEFGYTSSDFGSKVYLSLVRGRRKCSSLLLCEGKLPLPRFYFLDVALKTSSGWRTRRYSENKFRVAGVTLEKVQGSVGVFVSGVILITSSG